MAGPASSAGLAAIIASGAKSDFRFIEPEPARAIGYLLRAINEQQQGVIRATTIDLITQNNEERRATHDEFVRKVDEVKAAVITVNDARAKSDANRSEQDA